MANAMNPPMAAPAMAPVENELPALFSREPPMAEAVSEGTTLVAPDEGTPVESSTEDEETVAVGVREGALSVTMRVCLVTVTWSLLGIVWVVPESVMVFVGRSSVSVLVSVSVVGPSSSLLEDVTVEDAVLALAELALAARFVLNHFSLSSSRQYPRPHGSSVQHPLNLPEWHTQKYCLSSQAVSSRRGTTSMCIVATNEKEIKKRERGIGKDKEETHQILR